MSKDLAVTLLAQGSNGNEILQILDSIVDEFNDNTETEEDE